MNPDTRIPQGEPGLREDPERRAAGREQAPAPGQQSRKESNSREQPDHLPGYGEPPPEARGHKLPDQGW